MYTDVPLSFTWLVQDTLHCFCQDVGRQLFFQQIGAYELDIFNFLLYRERRSTMAEIVEQVQEREAAQVCMPCSVYSNTVFTVKNLCSASVS